MSGVHGPGFHKVDVGVPRRLRLADLILQPVMWGALEMNRTRFWGRDRTRRLFGQATLEGLCLTFDSQPYPCWKSAWKNHSWDVTSYNDNKEA